MLTAQQKKEFSSLKVEIIDLNILAFFYTRKISRLAYLFKKSTRIHIIEEFTALRYMENGLILHLTNLDDDNSNYSFRKASKEINRGKNDQLKLKKLNAKITSYRNAINSLKVQHRNKRIAHLNYLNDLEMDEFLNFDVAIKPLISQANDLGDFIWGHQINYQFKLGSLEGTLDFRVLFDNLTFDVTKLNSLH